MTILMLHTDSYMDVALSHPETLTYDQLLEWVRNRRHEDALEVMDLRSELDDSECQLEEAIDDTERLEERADRAEDKLDQLDELFTNWVDSGDVVAVSYGVQAHQLLTDLKDI